MISFLISLFNKYIHFRRQQLLLLEFNIYFRVVLFYIRDSSAGIQDLARLHVVT